MLRMVSLLGLMGLMPLTLASAADPAREDPAATAMLAEARAARAGWSDFPGFSADLEINQDGKVFKTKLNVSDKGKVTLEGTDESLAWAQRTLASVMGHRFSGSSAKTPCGFVDAQTEHPLGRAVRPLDDEYHSSYRIRDRKILVVNRQQGDARFTITSLETKLNPENKILPVTFVVDTWDLKSGALRSSDANHQTWVRLKNFDLPASVLVVTSKAGVQEVRSLKLANHQLK